MNYSTMASPTPLHKVPSLLSEKSLSLPALVPLSENENPENEPKASDDFLTSPENSFHPIDEDYYYYQTGNGPCSPINMQVVGEGDDEDETSPSEKRIWHKIEKNELYSSMLERVKNGEVFKMEVDKDAAGEIDEDDAVEEYLTFVKAQAEIENIKRAEKIKSIRVECEAHNNTSPALQTELIDPSDDRFFLTESHFPENAKEWRRNVILYFKHSVKNEKADLVLPKKGSNSVDPSKLRQMMEDSKKTAAQSVGKNEENEPKMTHLEACERIEEIYSNITDNTWKLDDFLEELFELLTYLEETTIDDDMSYYLQQICKFCAKRIILENEFDLRDKYLVLIVIIEDVFNLRCVSVDMCMNKGG